jgi:hypothetical protein
MAALGVVALLLSTGLGTALAVGGGAGGEEKGEVYADYSLLQTRTISQNGNNGQSLDVDVREHNVTNLLAVLTWTDDEAINIIGRRADVLTIVVKGPAQLDQEEQQAQGSAGSLRVNFTLASVPSDPDPGHLKANDYTNATGTWKVTVTVEPRGIRDQGNDWGLSVRYSYYVGRVIPKPGGA